MTFVFTARLLAEIFYTILSGFFFQRLSKGEGQVHPKPVGLNNYFSGLGAKLLNPIEWGGIDGSGQ